MMSWTAYEHMGQGIQMLSGLPKILKNHKKK